MRIVLYFVTSEGVYVKVGLTNLRRLLVPVLRSRNIVVEARDGMANVESWPHCNSPITVVWAGLRAKQSLLTFSVRIVSSDLIPIFFRL